LLAGAVVRHRSIPRHVKTEVLVENGGTVVIGGIYEQRVDNSTQRIPFLGDLPYIGFLFKNRTRYRRQDRAAGLHHATDRHRAFRLR
jgi:type II secretory pathway component GspD/PulD (secretin)